MHKTITQELLYDHMPKPDAKVPPISYPKAVGEDAKRLVDASEQEEAKDLLSNLSFN